MWSIFSRDPSKDFAYEINEPVSQYDEKSSFWILHKGKKKTTGEIVSIFRYESKPNEESYFELAKNSLKRLKTLRHPSILTYFDSLETEKYIIIVTEYVEPLTCFLNQMSSWSELQKESALSWGILSVAKGLCFLNNDCKLVHGCLSMNSILINNSSDWKIFNLEYLTNIGASQPPKSFYSHKIYTPPDVVEYRTTSDKYIDSWGLSCLIWEIFNGPLSDQSQLKNTNRLPKKLISLYTALNKNPSKCLIQDFIQKGQEKNAYFKNQFIDTMNFLEEIQIKDSTEKNRFFSNLNNLLEQFPVYFCKNKILPLVINSLEYGDANSHSLDLLIKIGKSLNESEYQKKIIPSIVKLFASKDRSIRSKLLKEIEEYIDHTPASAVNDQIFPYLVHGFMDSNPVIREQTVKSIFHMAPKLNYQNLNDEVIKHFSRIQMKDPEGGIRTNTIICMGKIAAHLQPQTRQTIVLPLFMRSMRDPFPPSRIACIQSLCATQNFFTLQDCTTKIMPTLCLILMDPEKQVRDQAFTALKNFIVKIEKFSENPALIEQMESEINKSGSIVSSKFTSGLSWAVSSLAAKLTRTKMENTSVSESNHSECNNVQENNEKKTQNKIAINEQPKEDITKSNTLNTDAIGLNTDGWDEDNWEDDLMTEFDHVPKPRNTIENIIKSTTNKSEKTTNNLDDNGWDDDHMFGDDIKSLKTSQQPKTTSSDNIPPITRTRTVASTDDNKSQFQQRQTGTKPKKGPMKLGAQKLKKSFD